MAFNITLFCKAGKASAPEAAEALLSTLGTRENGIEIRQSEKGEGQASYELASARTTDGRTDAEPVMLEVHSNEFIVQCTVSEYGDADNAIRIADTDLLITITITGQAADWALVKNIWQSAVRLWDVVPHNDVSGFDADLNSL